MSAYELVKDLCSELVKNADGFNENEARNIAFSTLLFKSPEHRENERNSVLEQLDYVCFETKIVQDLDENSRKYVDAQFDKYSRIYSQNTDRLEGISQILFLLRNTNPKSFFQERNQFFQLAEFPKSPKENPYLANFYRINLQNATQQNSSFMSLNFDKFTDVDLERRNKSLSSDCTFFSDTLTTLIHKNTRTEAPRVVERKKKVEAIKSSSTSKSQGHITTKSSDEELVDPQTLLYLLSVKTQREEELEARLDQLNNLMWEIKYLNVGVRSNKFILNNDQIAFEMQKDVDIENFSCEAVEHFMHEFILAGTCYKRLKCLIKKTYDFKHLFAGVVFRVSL